VAGLCAEIAAVDSLLGPAPFRLRYRTMAGSMKSKVDLIFRFRHVSATVGLIVNFVVAVGLRILVDDVSGHNFVLVGLAVATPRADRRGLFKLCEGKSLS